MRSGERAAGACSCCPARPESARARSWPRFGELLPDLWYSVSATTRAMRPGEIDGVNYHFVSRRASSTSWSPPASCWSTRTSPATATAPRVTRSRNGSPAGEDVLLEIEVQGARQVRAAPGLGAEAVLIFLAPPSFDELARRLVGRGTEDAATRRPGWPRRGPSWPPSRSSTTPW